MPMHILLWHMNVVQLKQQGAMMYAQDFMLPALADAQWPHQHRSSWLAMHKTSLQLTSAGGMLSL